MKPHCVHSVFEKFTEKQFKKKTIQNRILKKKNNFLCVTYIILFFLLFYLVFILLVENNKRTHNSGYAYILVCTYIFISYSQNVLKIKAVLYMHIVNIII